MKIKLETQPKYLIELSEAELVLIYELTGRLCTNDLKEIWDKDRETKFMRNITSDEADIANNGIYAAIHSFITH